MLSNRALGGPLERTAAEQERIRRVAAFRRDRELRWRIRLRRSDLLLDLVEQCRLRGWRLLPGQLWAEVVRFVGEVDPLLRDELGINRHTDHVSDVLFSAQERVLAESVDERRPRLAEIIQLFPVAGTASVGPADIDAADSDAAS